MASGLPVKVEDAVLDNVLSRGRHLVIGSWKTWETRSLWHGYKQEILHPPGNPKMWHVEYATKVYTKRESTGQPSPVRGRVIRQALLFPRPSSCTCGICSMLPSLPSTRDLAMQKSPSRILNHHRKKVSNKLRLPRSAAMPHRRFYGSRPMQIRYAITTTAKMCAVRFRCWLK